MRKLATALLALPVLAVVYLSAFVRGSVIARAGILLLGVMLVASGLIIGLPAKPSAARGPTTFAPLSPASFTIRVPNNVALDEPIEIDFTKPMNEESVALNVVIAPEIHPTLTWDSEGKKLLITGSPQWAPVTYYTVDIPGTVLGSDGVALGQPIHVVFMTGAATQGTFSATIATGDRIATTTSFQLSFNRAVPIQAVATHFRIDPDVPGELTGDDPTDASSHVFTFRPLSPLPADTQFTLSLEAGGVDKSGVGLAAVTPLVVKTVSAPGVVRFRPLDGAKDVDPAQAVSVRFTMPMDTATSTSAFTATVNGTPVTGATRWAENDTVLVLTPSSKLPYSAQVTLSVSTAARAKSGASLAKPVTASFAVVAKPAPAPQPTTKPISKPSVGSIASAPWYNFEVYSLRLLNCTRTGGWVSSTGSCVAGANRWGRAPALPLDAGISSRVARPYAKWMADHNVLTHYGYGSTPGTRLAAGGYTGADWRENISWPPPSYSGMVRTATFFQSEAGTAKCAGGAICHFNSLMNPNMHRVGIGVWVERSRAWVVFDFWGA